MAEVNPCRIRRGIVTTHPDGYKASDGAHFAITCCGRSECRKKFQAEARRVTGLPSFYVADDKRLDAVPR